jgi:ketopantoate reductase
MDPTTAISVAVVGGIVVNSVMEFVRTIVTQRHAQEARTVETAKVIAVITTEISGVKAILEHHGVALDRLPCRALGGACQLNRESA